MYSGQMYIDDLESLDGAWKGHYINEHGINGNPNFTGEMASVFPLEATFLSRDGNLTGTMIDLRTREELSIREYRESVRGLLSFPQSLLFTLTSWLRPGLRIRQDLAPNSQISGTINGSTVQFTKTYDGESTWTWINENGTTTVASTPSRPVEYQGQLSDDLRTIEGEWSIPTNKLPRKAQKFARGAFRLERVD